jgi:outer membrane protein assembly factor BamE
MQPCARKLAYLLAAAGGLALTAACTTTSHYFESVRIPLVYRVDVQQGNVITQDMLAQLERGMDKNKVRFIMGTPLLVDVFHQDRWDYVYTMRNGSDRPVQRRVSVFFEHDRLAHLDGDVKAARGTLAHVPRPEVTVEVPGAAKPSLTERLLATIGLAGEEAQPTRDEGAEDRQEEGVTLATTRDRRDPLLVPETEQ